MLRKVAMSPDIVETDLLLLINIKMGRKLLDHISR